MHNQKSCSLFHKFIAYCEPFHPRKGKHLYNLCPLSEGQKTASIKRENWLFRVALSSLQRYLRKMRFKVLKLHKYFIINDVQANKTVTDTSFPKTTKTLQKMTVSYYHLCNATTTLQKAINTTALRVSPTLGRAWRSTCHIPHCDWVPSTAKQGNYSLKAHKIFYSHSQITTTHVEMHNREEGSCSPNTVMFNEALSACTTHAKV